MLTSIILAAGEGTRMKSQLPKVIHKLCNRSMINYVVHAANEARVNQNILVVGHGGNQVIEAVRGNNVETVRQPIGEQYPYGTAYAVMQAKDYIKDDDYIIILSGDTPLITGDTISKLTDFHKKQENIVTVLTAELDNPKGYGRMIRDNSDNIIKIVEEKDANQDEKMIREINSGISCFNGQNLREVLDEIDNDNAQGEYYITDAIQLLNNQGHKVGGYKLEDNTEIMGINSKVQLAEAEALMRERINKKLMTEGVIMINPKQTYIEPSVIIGRDTVVYPGTIIEGGTKIGENCLIGHNTRIVDSIIGDNVTIQSSTILGSEVDEDTNIGPYAYIRPNSRIGKSVKIGDFVEVKNATLGNGTKASHLAYIGDAEVGEQVNIGCGVVFVNYDGKTKHKTIVENHAFIGSNSNLIAPVIVREKGYVAAGSTITKEVEKGALSIARSKQFNKEGWVEKKQREREKNKENK